jgi:hypothetical protein
MNENKYDRTIDNIIKTPHTPTLKYIDDRDGGLFLGELRDNVFFKTNVRVNAKCVGHFCYTTEEFYQPVKRKCAEKKIILNDIEIDTKLLRTWYPKLDFDAYSFVPIGLGLNIVGLSRISGNLYKIEKRKMKNGMH